MDGSVVIGVELEDQGFSAALQRLRQTAEQSVVAALGQMVKGLDATETAFAENAAAGSVWSGQMQSLFAGVRTGASALLPELLALGRQAGSQFLSGLLSVNGAAAGATLASAVRSGFTANWYSLGYSVASGIASGIRGGSSLITQAAQSAAQSALAAAKRSLGVHSPSRVFRDQVGRMIPAGIAQGISEGAGEAETALRVQSEQLVRAAQRDVLSSLERVSGNRSEAAAGGACRLTVEAPLYLDGRELARATADYTGQQLMWEAV